MGGAYIEFSYEADSGHTWIVRVDRGNLPGAVDAVFRWLTTVQEFGAKELGMFLAAILQDAIEQGIIDRSAYPVVEKIIYAIPKTALPHGTQVNMMRAIMRAAVDSTA
jgi:hypothetical protein